jgi:ubiquitin domain-containing protein
MASNGPASTASTASPTEAKLSILHILSPSPDVPQRLTFNDIPLATNIADLKQRISQSLPTQPPASQQRLIYRGRPLLNDWTTLEDILDPSDVSVIITSAMIRAQRSILINLL